MSAPTLKERDGDDEPSNWREHKKYEFVVMSIMFIAGLSKIDLLFWTFHPATKCSKLTEADFRDCMRALVFMKHKRDWEIRDKCAVRPAILVSPDSNHNLHKNTKGW